MIKIKLNDQTFTIKSYSTTIISFFKEHHITNIDSNYHDNPVIAALVNNRLCSLHSLLNLDCKIEPVYLFSDIGKRIYRRSLSFLLSYASFLVFKSNNIVIQHSLGDGFYYKFKKEIKKDDIAKIKNTMIDLVNQEKPIYKENYSYEKVLNYFKEVKSDSTCSLLEYKNDPKLVVYRIDSYMDLTNEALVSNTKILKLWDLKSYDNGMLLRYPRSFDYHNLDTFKDNPLLYKVLSKSCERGKILNLDCLGSLNKMCLKNNIEQAILKSEAILTNNIYKIAKDIKKRNTIRTVTIAGPSSSGKTTTSYKIQNQLECLGYNCIRISLDNYYKKAVDCPKNKDQSPDFEALEALDLTLLRKQVKDLYDGKVVNLALYSFEKQERTFSKINTKLKPNDILILEGIHALNPDLLKNIDQNTLYKVYVSALTQINFDDHNRISTTDTRLLRRIVRDNSFRGTSALDTINMWKSVQNGENKYIFPYQNNADYMLNSALDYELGVIATFAKPLLMSVKSFDGKAYYTSLRLLSFIDNIYPIPPNLVPYDSLLREFIGDSIYDV